MLRLNAWTALPCCIDNHSLARGARPYRTPDEAQSSDTVKSLAVTRQ